MKKRLPISCGELQRLYLEEGLSMAALARQLGCSAPTIGRRLRECGIATRSGRFEQREIPRAALVRLYLDEGLPLRAIAKRLGVSVGTVNNWRRACGLPGRRAARRGEERHSGAAPSEARR
ncbi:MAG: DUF1804 family protein [Chloroflexaceae bacterium]|nr:DUF1804 family protein [Chloroflexaceae bacterium]